MAKGSKYWANSYILLKNGQKIYLTNFVSDIKEKIYSDQRFIELNVSGLFGKTIKLNKHFIYQYGKV